jgi:hypothetical protein
MPASRVMIQVSGIVEADDAGKDLHLEHGHRHPDGGEHRADREVDVAGDDDEHHPGGHDRHRGGLHREVPEVAGGEERPTREDVEPDPDHRQRNEHADEAGVDLGGSQKEPTDRRSLSTVLSVAVVVA